MIAHDGRKICVGWSDREILWLRALIATGVQLGDCKDVSGMMDPPRTPFAIRDMAYKLRKDDLALEWDWRTATRERKAAERRAHLSVTEPSSLKWPTPAQLMAGSTRVRTYNGRTT
jgi:hypothetical protein